MKKRTYGEVLKAKPQKAKAKMAERMRKKEESLRKRPGGKEYIVRTNGKSAAEAKTELWSVLTMMGTPRMRSIKILERGDMIIRPADEQTSCMLEKTAICGMDIGVSQKWRPRVLLYDVDRDMPREEIATAICR